jgi:hypothetical protein
MEARYGGYEDVRMRLAFLCIIGRRLHVHQIFDIGDPFVLSWSGRQVSAARWWTPTEPQAPDTNWLGPAKADGGTGRVFR